MILETTLHLVSLDCMITKVFGPSAVTFRVPSTLTRCETLELNDFRLEPDSFETSEGWPRLQHLHMRFSEFDTPKFESTPLGADCLLLA